MWFFYELRLGMRRGGQLGDPGPRFEDVYAGVLLDRLRLGGRERNGWGSTRQPHSAESESGDAVLTCRSVKKRKKKHRRTDYPLQHLFSVG